ncbi:hypothetical protein MSIBF_A2390001 [groundwater metagenome]|uniref:Uncharacterized protein n=1 Tax=groundwater metagenome TaxID=717931 RepID=A0A098EBV5_9ZZZZ
MQASSEVEILESVGRNVFFPVPDVDSVIIKVVQKFPDRRKFYKFC